MLTIYFLLIFYSGKDYFLIKKNKIMNKIMLNFVSLNIIYIIFIFIFNIDYGRYLLVKETFVEIFNGYTIFPSNFFYEKELLYSSHNQLLEIVRTSGLIGLLYFLWFIDRIFNKSNNMMQLILTIYLYIGIGLFVLPFTHPYSYFVLGLIILITGGFNSSDKNNARN
jgi:hypothetical protein